MSDAVERKILEMQFDNAEFERRVAKSMRTIESLKKELDFDEGAKSLDRLEKAANDISFKGLEKETKSLGDLFDWGSIFKITLLQKVADQVIGTASRMLKSLTIDNVGAGMTKYEMKTKSVQTIMAATGKSVQEVEKVLERLNYYTDMTSYDFADMTNNIGKFTSAGIDLETAEVAMEGIANWAAVSGQETAQAARAMYNMSQALSAGHVKLIDWKSIENANMATKEFKEYVIDTAIAMGKLKQVGDKVGKTLKGTAVDYKNFSQTLQEGWFDNDVLIATLTQYADTNTEIGAKSYEAARKALTFTQSMQAVRDSISTGWMKTWQLLFGDVEEAGDFFTDLCDSIIAVTERIDEARNNLLQEWRDFTSIFTDENGNNYKGKDMASLIFHTVWDTIVSVGAAISRAIEMVANPSSVLFGEGGFDTGGWKIAFDEIEDLATGNMLGKVTDGILNMAGAVRAFLYGDSIFGGQRIVKLVHIFTGFFSLLDIGRQIIGSILGFIGRIAMFLSPLIDGVLEIGSAIGDVLYMIDLSLRSGGLKALGDSLFEFLRPALEWIRDKGRVVIDWVLEQIRKIPDVIDIITKKMTSFLNTLTKWGKKVRKVFEPIERPLRLIWETVKGWFSGEGLENLSLWDKIQTVWDRIKNTDFSKWKISFDVAFERIKYRFNNLWTDIKTAVKEKWGIDLSWVDTAIQTVRTKWDQFTSWWQSTSVYKWFTEADKKTGLTGFQTVVYAIGDAFKDAWDFFTESDENGETGFVRWKKDLLARCEEIRNAIMVWPGWKAIGNFFGSIWDYFTKDESEERFINGETIVVNQGTKFQKDIENFKRTIDNIGFELERWWVNPNSVVPSVLKTIGQGIADGFTAVWNFFKEEDSDGKTGFDRWKESVYARYEEVKEAITTWSGWKDIQDFFSGIWDYFTKKSYKQTGTVQDEDGNIIARVYEYKTGFEVGIDNMKKWLTEAGESISNWWKSDNAIATAFRTIAKGIADGAVGIWDYFTKKQYREVGSTRNAEGTPIGGIYEYTTGFDATIKRVKDWFNQAGKDFTEWWNKDDNYLRVAFEAIGTALSTVWDYFTVGNPDKNGKTGFEQTIDDVKTKLEEMKENINTWWNDDGKVIPSTLKKIGKGISEGLTTMWNYFTEGIYIGDKYDAQGNYLGPEFQTAFEGDVEEVKAWFKRVGKDLEDWWKKDDNYLRKAFEFIEGEIENLLGWFQSESSIRYESQEGQSPFFTFFQNLGEDITNAWKDATKEGTFLGDLFSVVSGFFSGIWEAAFGAPDGGINEKEIEDAWREYNMKFNGAMAQAMATDFTFSGGGKAKGDKMTYEEFRESYIEDYVEKHAGVLGFLRTVWEKIQEWVNKIQNSDAYKTVTKFFSDLWESVKGFFTEIDPNTGKTGWKQTLEDVIQWISDTYDKVKEWGGWEKIGGFFRDVFGSISDFFKNLFSGGEEAEKAVEGKPPIKKSIDPVAIQFGIDEEQLKKGLDTGKKELSILELVGKLLEQAGNVLSLSGIKELKDIGSLAPSVTNALSGVWDLAKNIINFVFMDGNVFWIIARAELVKVALGSLSNLFGAVFNLVGNLLSGAISSGLKKLVQRNGKLGKWLEESKGAVDNMDKTKGFLMAVAAFVAAVGFAFGSVKGAEWGDIGKFAAVLAVATTAAILIMDHLSKLQPRQLQQKSDSVLKNENMWRSITIMASLLASELISFLGVIGIITLVANQSSNLAKLKTGQLAEIGSLIKDVMLSMAVIMIATALAFRLTDNLQGTMNAGAIAKFMLGVGEVIGFLLLYIDLAGLLAMGIDGLAGEGTTLKILQTGSDIIGEIGAAIGNIFGKLVGPFNAKNIQLTAAANAEAEASAVQSAIDFADTIVGLANKTDDADVNAFEKLVQFLERLGNIGDRIYNFSIEGKISGMGEEMEKFQQSVIKIGNNVNNVNFGPFRDLLSSIGLLTDLIIAMKENEDELNEALGQDNLGATRDMLFGVMAELLSSTEDGSTTLAQHLGWMMNDFYRGMNDSVKLSGAVSEYGTALDGMFSSQNEYFIHAGYIIAAGIAEGIAAGGELAVTSATLLGTATLAAYNKATKEDLSSQYQNLMTLWNKYGVQGLGTNNNSFAKLINSVNDAGNKKTTDDLLEDILGFKLSDMTDSMSGLSTTLENQMKQVFIGTKDNPGLVSEMQKYAESMTNGENGFLTIFSSTLTSEENGINAITDAELSDVVGTLEGYVDDMEKAGKNLTRGISRGLQDPNAVNEATGAAGLVARLVLEKFHQVWRIGSPSKETEQFGEWLIEGLEIGITDEGSTFIQIIAKIGDTIGEAISTAIVNAIQEAFGLVHKEANDVFASGIITEEPPLLDASKMGGVVEEIEERFENGEITYIPIGAKLVTYDPAIGPLPDSAKKVSEILDGELEKWQDSLGLYKPGEAKPLIDWDQIKLNDQKEAGKAGEETKKSFNDAVRSSLTNSIKGIFDLADSDLTYEPVIRPIIDWSNVTANVGYGGRILSDMPGLTGGTYAAGTLEETMKIQNGKNNGDLYNVVVDIRDKVDQLDRDVMNMKIVLNTGVLAGELVNDIDNELGQRVLNNGRAN